MSFFSTLQASNNFFYLSLFPEFMMITFILVLFLGHNNFSRNQLEYYYTNTWSINAVLKFSLFAIFSFFGFSFNVIASCDSGAPAGGNTPVIGGVIFIVIVGAIYTIYLNLTKKTQSVPDQPSTDLLNIKSVPEEVPSNSLQEVINSPNHIDVITEVIGPTDNVVNAINNTLSLSQSLGIFTIAISFLVFGELLGALGTRFLYLSSPSSPSMLVGHLKHTLDQRALESKIALDAHALAESEFDIANERFKCEATKCMELEQNGALAETVTAAFLIAESYESLLDKASTKLEMAENLLELSQYELKLAKDVYMDFTSSHQSEADEKNDSSD